eukprot:scaffold321302_cov12-Tisochrysis_lutea.AAC.1
MGSSTGAVIWIRAHGHRAAPTNLLQKSIKQPKKKRPNCKEPAVLLSSPATLPVGQALGSGSEHHKPLHFSIHA